MFNSNYFHKINSVQTTKSNNCKANGTCSNSQTYNNKDQLNLFVK